MTWSLGKGTTFNPGYQADEESPALVDDRGRALLYRGYIPGGGRGFVFVYKSPSIKVGKILLTGKRIPSADGKTARWELRFTPGFDQAGDWNPSPPTSGQIEQMKLEIADALCAFPTWPTDLEETPETKLPASAVQFVE